MEWWASHLGGYVVTFGSDSRYADHSLGQHMTADNVALAGGDAFCSSQAMMPAGGPHRRAPIAADNEANMNRTQWHRDSGQCRPCRTTSIERCQDDALDESSVTSWRVCLDVRIELRRLLSCCARMDRNGERELGMDQRAV